MTEDQKAREARAKADGILADYVKPGFQGIDDGNLYFAAMAYKESHDALAEKVRVLREALEFYAGSKDSSWAGVTFLAFDKFGGLDASLCGPAVARKALRAAGEGEA